MPMGDVAVFSGQGRVRRGGIMSKFAARMTTAAFAAVLASSLTAWPATQAQIDQAWTKGIWWLFANQSGDGFWKSTDGTQIAATASAIEALSNAHLRSYPFYNGVTWLSNARATSTDSL